MKTNSVVALHRELFLACRRWNETVTSELSSPARYPVQTKDTGLLPRTWIQQWFGGLWRSWRLLELESHWRASCGGCLEKVMTICLWTICWRIYLSFVQTLWMRKARLKFVSRPLFPQTPLPGKNPRNFRCATRSWEKSGTPKTKHLAVLSDWSGVRCKEEVKKRCRFAPT